MVENRTIQLRKGHPRDAPVAPKATEAPALIQRGPGNPTTKKGPALMRRRGPNSSKATLPLPSWG